MFTKRNTGQSLVEYGIIGLFILLMAIPAISLLGINIDSLFKGDLSGNFGNAVNRNGIGLPSDNTTAGSDGKIFDIFDPKPQTPTYAAVYDPGTRTISYRVPPIKDTEGGNKTASMKRATRHFASEIDRLVNMTGLDGKPLPEDVASLIMRLAGKAYALAKEQNRQDKITAQGGKKDNILMLIQAGKEFERAYEQLILKLEDAKYAELKSVLASYSGVISQVNHNYVEPVAPGSVTVIGTAPEGFQSPLNN